MIDLTPTEAFPQAVQDAAKPFLQGQLLKDPPLFYAADLRHPIHDISRALAAESDDPGADFVGLGSSPYGIITSQTCDIVEEDGVPRQPWIMVAPVYATDRNPGSSLPGFLYALNPPADGQRELAQGMWVADLRIEVPLEKSLLVGRTPIDAFQSEDDYVEFGNRLAFRRGRPALASVIHELLSTTTDSLVEDRENKTQARAARKAVHSLRLQIRDGSRLAPKDFALHVVVHGGDDDEGANNHAAAKPFLDTWWQEARTVAQQHGLRLQPTEWHRARACDLALLDTLVPMAIPF